MKDRICLKSITYGQTVAIFSNRYPQLLATATYSDGKITTKAAIKYTELKHAEKCSMSMRAKKVLFLVIALITYLSIAVVGFLGTKFFGNSMFYYAILTIMMDNILNKCIIPVFIFRKVTSAISGINSSNGLHAAEHKVINAYEKKQGMPTMEEIKKATMFSPYCSTCSGLEMAFPMYFTYFVCSFAPRNINTWTSTFILIILLIICITISDNLKLYKYAAIFSLIKPKDFELETAKAALELWEKMENAYDDFDKELNEIIFAHVSSELMNKLGFSIRISFKDEAEMPEIKVTSIYGEIEKIDLDSLKDFKEFLDSRIEDDENQN